MPLSLAQPQKSKLLKNNIKKNYKNHISPEYARSYILKQGINEILVFEARNLPQARERRKQAERNSKAFQRAQKMLLEVSSPNLMNFSDTTDPDQPQINFICA